MTGFNFERRPLILAERASELAAKLALDLVPSAKLLYWTAGGRYELIGFRCSSALGRRLSESQRAETPAESARKGLLRSHFGRRLNDAHKTSDRGGGASPK